MKYKIKQRPSGSMVLWIRETWMIWIFPLHVWEEHGTFKDLESLKEYLEVIKLEI